MTYEDVKSLRIAYAAPVSADVAAPQAVAPDVRAEAPPAAGAPFGELGANGPDVEACVRDAVDSLTSRQTRDALGRYIAGNAGAVTTGARSELLWAALAPAKRDLVERVKADRGMNGDAAETLLGLVDGYAEVRLFRQSMFIRLVDLGGVVTTKGRSRALYTAYLNALDRETKLAQLLGLERQARRVPSLADVMSGEADA